MENEEFNTDNSALDEKVKPKKENAFIKWLKTLFYEEYYLTIWFAGKTVLKDDGNKEFVRTPKSHKVSKVHTLKPNLIKFTNTDGELIEIRSEEPMNWDLVKKY